jgi:hypothetical protein
MQKAFSNFQIQSKSQRHRFWSENLMITETLLQQDGILHRSTDMLSTAICLGRILKNWPTKLQVTYRCCCWSHHLLLINFSIFKSSISATFLTIHITFSEWFRSLATNSRLFSSKILLEYSATGELWSCGTHAQSLAAVCPPKKLYTLEGKPPSAFVRSVVGEGLSTLPDFVQKCWRG